jgi:hypothetical protein
MSNSPIVLAIRILRITLNKPVVDTGDGMLIKSRKIIGESDPADF